METVISSGDGNKVNIFDEPLLVAPGIAIKIDKAVLAGTVAAISGWVSSSLVIDIKKTKKYLTFGRSDVNKNIYTGVKGFVLFVEVGPSQRNLRFNLRLGDFSFDPVVPLATDMKELVAFVVEHGQRLPYVFGELLGVKEWAKLIYPIVQLGSSEKAIASIDHCRAVGSYGVSVFGWCVARQDVNVFFMAENGTMRKLEEAIRFPRGDVVEKFKTDYGLFADEAGFFISLNGGLAQGGKVAIIAEVAGFYFKVVEKLVDKVSWNPVGYAKWSFALPIPKNRFSEKMDEHDGIYLQKLIEEVSPSLTEMPVDMWCVGARPSNPIASIVIPIYGRFDFIEHQLLAFKDDFDFKGAFAEIIYVIDDPLLVDSIKDQADYYELVYGVPVTFVTVGRNLGYAQANNLGASVARGDYLVFMNSDVIPEQNSWVSRMINTIIEHPEIGVLGARLLYPQGAIQHIGMYFEFSREMGAWLNQHDLIGMPINNSLPVLRKVAAVTGACMAVRKSYFEQVSGFSKHYLIGDFEDSDLCLKINRLGADIACLTDTNLVHLERQSFKFCEQDEGFRQMVVYFNAWQHAKKWSEAIRLFSGN